MRVWRRGRELTGELAVAERREWLIANGRGSYALGTIAGTRTRAYHGLLVAALDGPAVRRLVVADVAIEALTGDGPAVGLGTNRWRSGAIAPEGWRTQTAFALVDGVPHWTHAIGETVIERALAIDQDEDVLAVALRVVAARGPVELRLRVLAHDRDHHGGPLPAGFETALVDGGASIRLPASGTALRARGRGATWQIAGERYRDYALPREAERGLADGDDAWHALDAAFTLAAGERAGLVLGLADAGDDPWRIVRARRARAAAIAAAQPTPARRTLAVAADAFVVARPGGGTTVVAGYPWFADWGRDAMVALPGLLLATRRLREARDLLVTFARCVDGGMLPNRFPDGGGAPEYNTVDAALWFVEAVRAYVEASGDADGLAELWPAVEAIIAGYRAGTRYGIGVDADGLVGAGEPGVQLTWMDAKVDGRVITPRIGKPVEINALWYAALRAAAGFAQRLGRSAAPYDALADQVAAAFPRYVAPEGWLYDVLDGPDGDDASLRPNQLVAFALHAAPLGDEVARRVVDVCARRLWTPMGLRTLDPADPRYRGIYGGGRVARDEAYHQGTAWPWLIAPFVRAHLRTYGDPAAARRYAAPLLDGLDRLGIGTLAEIASGDAPFVPDGCVAQAWSVAAALETLAVLDA